MIRKIHEAREEEGFTLIELLVVVIIIGILAAIAIPTFLNQREKAWQSAAKSDLRNSAVVMEEHFNDTGSYANYAGTFKTSDGVTVTIAATPAASTTVYCLNADHAKLGAAGSVDFHLNSTVGKPAANACA
ncbi:MAG: prepilin-type N-terminal cleavage/methylation domain-containing protein [Actinobacteria bacterium]|nr:prepilin-type N-terminal cleavage/methylation domain-containing protein [Actinomycetota bacterium]